MREILINNFLRICSIPRKSGHEEKIANFFIEVAEANNLFYFWDEHNNILIKKKGNIKAKSIALQAHLDMVCVKAIGSSHNFAMDGIEVVIEKDKVTAKDTSLGADQGVALAIMLTILEDKNLKHPDLEFLFTVEEETTFKGAVTFPYSKVESKQLINLDNDKDDMVVIGADGDVCNEYCLKGTQIKNELPSYKLVLDGFLGGNSGVHIDASQNNAITTMAKMLQSKEIFIASIDGGSSENDLAESCEVILHTSLDVKKLFQSFNVKIENVSNDISFSVEDTTNIINQILELKCGYLTENVSSANLGSIRTSGNEVKLCYVVRSICEEEFDRINMETKVSSNNFEVREIYRDPIWNPNKQSKLLKRYQQVYFNQYATYPKVDIGHGGIECAVIQKQLDGVDIICIGSLLENIHTIKETTYIDSWVKVYQLLTKFLELEKC